MTQRKRTERRRRMSGDAILAALAAAIAIPIMVLSQFAIWESERVLAGIETAQSSAVCAEQTSAPTAEAVCQTIKPPPTPAPTPSANEYYADIETANSVQNSPPIDEQEDFENAKIEAALYASGYFRDDVPLDADTQSYLRAACDEFSIPYELALAVIHTETRFQNINGNGGNSIGYMQIQSRWHKNRMGELGVTDLTNPYQNFRVGCSILAELLDKYGSETDALTAYNTGSPGNSVYAKETLAYMEKLS